MQSNDSGRDGSVSSEGLGAGGWRIDFRSKGCRAAVHRHSAWRKALCVAGFHVFGRYALTRFNPAMNMSAYHCECACGLTKARLVWHRTVVDGCA